MIEKFNLEFILHIHLNSLAKIKSSLAEFGENIEVVVLAEDNPKGKDLKITMLTEDPTMIFDVCAQFGRIKSVKVNQEG
jgi:dihydroxyacetone kinase-like predicted kinase